jgi:RNA polymerase sigma-70 factor (ECF subfamily)
MGSWRNSIVDNSEDRFVLAYNEFSGMIYNLCYKMTGSREDAEDIVQKTFLQAHLSMDRFREESKLSTWLYAIAKNLCYQYLSNKKRSTFLSFQKLIIDNQSGNQDHLYSGIEKEYYIKQVREGCLLGLLRCLPLQQRLAFILHVLLHVDFNSVAAILGKSESAARTLAHRARKSIKAFLCEHCSLYHSGNPCSCDNFISFSLERGWIEPFGGMNKSCSSAFYAESIAGEINELKKLTSLYASLPEWLPSDQLTDHIKKSISNQDYSIFAQRKVK